MPVISCTHCGAKGNAPDSVLGQTVRCSKCKQSFVASSDGASSPSAPALEAESYRDEEPRAPARRRDREDAYDDEEDEPVRRKPKRRSIRGGDNWFLEFIAFRRFVAPYIIMVAYWLGTFGIIVMGLMAFVGAFRFGGEMAVFLVFTAMMYIILGPIFVRLYCELLVVAFRVYETLQDILSELRK